jgi:hypothetical protein
MLKISHSVLGELMELEPDLSMGIIQVLSDFTQLKVSQ